ncbi:MAG: beta-N-acetylhexosaminidase, partial [Planctomycetota bacterium]
MERCKGSLVLKPAIGIAAAGELLPAARLLACDLSKPLGRRPDVEEGGAGESGLLITRDGASESMPEEGYRLSVTPRGVVLRARTAAGAFRGTRTLLQLLPAEGPVGEMPCLEIEDAPRFGWRGLMLDVGRYFYPKECVLRFVDVLAMHKFNVFHWHLNEDQGWRLEIKAFPKLTEVGAWRRETVYGHGRLGNPGNGVFHGGFYSQEDVREIVAYAAERHITVVPEIEMPGHCQAVLASYPELGCATRPLEVSTHWGIHRDVYNAGKDEVFDFLFKVLEEVLDLFPSRYIHIGGDECPKDQWKVDELCRKRIREEGLKDEDELQSWFIRRVEEFLNERGRSLVGWDEILEGGLAPNATVMSWRGIEGGVAAARAGHDVVMTPNEWCYLDYYQGDPAREPLAIGGMLPLEKVYGFEPIPAELSDEEGAHVLGGQGNVWTEYMPDYRQVEYMTLPRAAALAEVFWSTKESRDLESFTSRVGQLCARYAAKGWLYRQG